jgi:hypothetical protein
MKPENITNSQWAKYNTLFVMEHFLGHNAFQKLFCNTERNLMKSIGEYASKHPPGDSFKLIEYKKGEWKEPLYDLSSPRIFRGAASDWPCTKKWSFDFFAEKYGNYDVKLFGNVGVRADNSPSIEKMTMQEYIKLVRTGSKKYLKFEQMIDHDSELQDDFDRKWLKKFEMNGDFGPHFFLFMGGKNSITPIHNEIQPAVFIQMVGEKKWTLYPPSDRVFLGVPSERRSFFYSSANPYNLNDPNYPLLKYSHPIEFTLYPGDVLWFPPHVFHQVENNTESIGVGYKFFHLPSAFATSKLLTILFFLATKPFLIKAILEARRNKSVYMFDNPDD